MKLINYLLLSSLVLPAAVERHFEENLGQAGVPAAEVQFLARDRGGQVFFTATEVLWDIDGRAPIRLRFAGAAGKAKWQSAGAQTGVISYVIGADSSKWVSGARQFDRIAWRGVYPGIDAVFYWNDGRLEYDLIVAPGADPSPVRLAWSGAPARLLADGSISIADGLLKQRKPQIHQGADRVEGRFRARAGEFHLALGRYDRRRPLVVDPVLEMATYIGGENDDAISVVSDGLIAGTTASVLFPGSTAARRRSRDAFVRGTGTLITNSSQLVGMVVFGGAGEEEVGGAISLSGARQVIVAGTTSSDDFPIALGSERVGPGTANGFICAFPLFAGAIGIDPSSCRLVGGSGEDRINALAGSNSTYVFAGETTSPDIPNAGGSYSGGKDGFFGHNLIPTGVPIVFYLGGPEDDRILSVGGINLNSFVLGGETRSPGFPYLNPDSPALQGPSDGFITNVTLTQFTPGAIPTFSSYLIGGSGEDRVTALTTTATLFAPSSIIPPTSVAIAGVTTSPDLPVQNAAQPALAGESDAFAGVWRQGSFEWLTYLGGSGADEATAIARNWVGDLFVTGSTRSTDLKTVSPIQGRPGGGEDAFYAVVGPGAVRHLTYYGGSGDDRANSLTLIRDGVARIGGVTNSPNLPQVNPWQSAPGQRTDGFLADLASSYLFAPSQLHLAKDGSIPIYARAAQNAPSLMVTYRSSDPSKVLLFDGVNSVPELTVPLSQEVRAEGFADSGEVQILITAPGFLSASTSVRLYPGVLVANGIPTVTNTWSGPLYLGAYWGPLDPDSGRPAVIVSAGLRTSSYDIRSGFRLPVLSWTSSDERVLRVVATYPYSYEVTQLAVGVPGEAIIRLSAQGLPVWPPDGILSKVVAPPLTGRASIRLGKDLQVGLPYSVGASTNYGEVRSGVITARSSDPSRLLLSTDSAVPGSASVSVPFSTRNYPPFPPILAQALAAEGEVPVIISSPDFSGEITTIVELEPSRLRWGLNNFLTRSLDSSVQTTVGGELQLSLQLEGVSGAPSSGLRPGVPELQLRLSNSAESVLEVNRVTIRQPSDAPRLFAISPGSATLTLSQPDSSSFPLVNSTVTVDVAPAPARLVFGAPPASVTIGKDLQQSLTFRYSGGSVPISVVSDDPAVLLVASAVTQPGQPSVALSPRPFSDEYSFSIHALRDSGESGVVIKYPGGEYRIRVTLVPSGIGFRSGYPLQGFDQTFELGMYALDELTGIPLFQQLLVPGKKIDVTLRATGAAVRLSRESATLDGSSTSPVLVGVTLPPIGQEAVLIAEAPGSSGRQTLRRQIRQLQAVKALTLMQDTMWSLYTQLLYTSSDRSASIKATSSDPESLLLSLDPNQPGRPSVEWNVDGPYRNIYLQALKGAGSVTVTFEGEGLAPAETIVSLSPLRIPVTFGGGANLNSVTFPANQSIPGTVGIQGNTWRPGAAPLRVALRSSDNSVATVTPESLTLSGSTNSASFTLATKSAGATVLSVESDRAPSVLASINVREASPATIPATELFLGGNTQLETSFTFGETNSNGAIVTVTSSDPSRLVVSRNSAILGGASTTLALQPGTQGGTIHLQALASDGEVIVTATAPGFAERRWRVRLGPAWFTPYIDNPNAPLGLGESRNLSYVLEREAPINAVGVRLRPGLGPLNLGIVATDPLSVQFAASSLSLPDGPDSNNISTQVRGAALGSTSIRFDQPPGFGPVPSGRGMASVRVAPRSMTLSCGAYSAFILGKDTQTACSISGAPAGTVVEAVSSDPSRLLISTDPLTAGSSRQTLTVGSNPVLIFQALAGSGTVEVLLTAPGFADLRLPAILRRTELRASTSSYPIPKGGSADLQFSLTFSGANYNVQARAGSNLRASVTANPSSIATIDPPSVTFAPGASSASVKVRGLAEGTAVLSITPPEGFLPSSQPPITVTVR